MKKILLVLFLSTCCFSAQRIANLKVADTLYDSTLGVVAASLSKYHLKVMPGNGRHTIDSADSVAKSAFSHDVDSAKSNFVVVGTQSNTSLGTAGGGYVKAAATTGLFGVASLKVDSAALADSAKKVDSARVSGYAHDVDSAKETFTSVGLVKGKDSAFITKGVNTSQGFRAATLSNLDTTVFAKGYVGTNGSLTTGILLGIAGLAGQVVDIDGQAARQIFMRRNTTSNTAGNLLQIVGGGATIGATNKASGGVQIADGKNTGSGGSTGISFYTQAIGTAGTSDNSSINVLTLYSRDRAAGTIEATITRTPVAQADQIVNNYVLTIQDYNIGSSWVYGNLYNTRVSGSLATTGYVLNFYCRPEAINLTGDIGSLIGFQTDPYVDGATCSGTITNVIGCNMAAGYYGGGATSTITNWRQLQIDNPNNGSTKVGLYINAISGGGTANYAIYSLGGTSCHVGSMGIGGTGTVNAKLVVSNNSLEGFEVDPISADQSIYVTAIDRSTSTYLKYLFRGFTYEFKIVNSSTTKVVITPTAGITAIDTIKTAGYSISGTDSTGTLKVTGTAGFNGATPQAKKTVPAAVVPVSTTASTQLTPWGFATQGQADSLSLKINQLTTLCDSLRAALVNIGIAQ
jgi:hypothetical protein